MEVSAGTRRVMTVARFLAWHAGVGGSCGACGAFPNAEGGVSVLRTWRQCGFESPNISCSRNNGRGLLPRDVRTGGRAWACSPSVKKRSRQ